MSIQKDEYIHALQPCNQDYGLASYTTHVECINFICEWRDLQFNVDSERQIFEKHFHDRFIYSQSFCQKSADQSCIYACTTLGNEPAIDLQKMPLLAKKKKSSFQMKLIMILAVTYLQAKLSHLGHRKPTRPY